MIIETSANQFYRVREAGDAALAHCWIGTQVKRVKGAWVDKAKARTELVRKAACRVVAPKMVVAATEIVGGELVVCEGDALGPVVARFPRTVEGHARATAYAEAVS